MVKELVEPAISWANMGNSYKYLHTHVQNYHGWSPLAFQNSTMLQSPFPSEFQIAQPPKCLYIWNSVIIQTLLLEMDG